MFGDAGVVLNAKIHLKPDGSPRGWGYVIPSFHHTLTPSHTPVHSILFTACRLLYTNTITYHHMILVLTDTHPSYSQFNLFFIYTAWWRFRPQRKRREPSIFSMERCNLLLYPWKSATIAHVIRTLLRGSQHLKPLNSKRLRLHSNSNRK